jgi:hypothetical protein
VIRLSAAALAVDGRSTSSSSSADLDVDYSRLRRRIPLDFPYLPMSRWLVPIIAAVLAGTPMVGVPAQAGYSR